MCANSDSNQPSSAQEKLSAVVERLRPLHSVLGSPDPGDWLAEHEETGQSFEQYIDAGPVTAHGDRRVICIQPIGDFAAAQRRVVDLAAAFIEQYFVLPVRVEQDLPLSVIPAHARRRHPSWGMEQILTKFVLRELLRPRLAADAATCLAFTAIDLWPREGWNFVFGSASVRHRVGIWSIYRNGDPAESDESFRLCFLRTVKTATHEIGHMFSMKHCIRYACNMNGSNHREESDRKPLALCPECVAKLCWATGADPAERYAGLSRFCANNGMPQEAARYQELGQALRER